MYVVAELNSKDQFYNGNIFGPFKDWQEAKKQAQEWDRDTTRHSYGVLPILPSDRYTHPGA